MILHSFRERFVHFRVVGPRIGKHNIEYNDLGAVFLQSIDQLCVKPSVPRLNVGLLQLQVRIVVHIYYNRLGRIDIWTRLEE